MVTYIILILSSSYVHVMLCSYVNEEGRVVADPNILTDLLFGLPTSTRDIKVLVLCCAAFYRATLHCAVGA